MTQIPPKSDPRSIAQAILRQAREISAIAEKTSGETSTMLMSAGNIITREAESMGRIPTEPTRQHYGELKRAGHVIARETELLKEISFHAPEDISINLTRVIAIISHVSEEIRCNPVADQGPAGDGTGQYENPVEND